MIAPFRRISKSKKRMRRSHQAISVNGVCVCPNCGELAISHRVCPNCGFYKGSKVVEIKEKTKSEE
jgi:large subunit ribosomal protein L32